jgi:hypothetical protein
MTDFQAYLWTCGGVIVAVILPVLKGFIMKQFPPTMAEEMLPPWVKKYGGLLVFGGVMAVVALAFWKSQNPSLQLQWYTAFLLGFTAEATLEKLVQKP